MYNKKIITITLAILLMLSTLAGCRNINGGDMSSGNISDITSTVYDIVDVIENESSELESTDNIASEDTQVIESDSNSSVTSEEIFTENIVSVGDEENKVDPDAPLTFIESDSETSSDTSEGYDKVTCTTSPDSKTGNVVTVPIAANGSVYYQIKGASKKILTIKSANAYVIYNGTKYESKNGVVSFFVESDELASAQIMFEIGNKGSKSESFTINFASPKGTRDNPEVIDSISNNLTANIEAGSQQGYSYTYVATKDGKIRFYILSDAKSGMLSVDKLINPKLGVIQQRNTTETQEDYVKSDKTGTYIEFDVKSGDKFNITASPNANPGVYPAVTVEWKIIYS